MMWSRTKDLWSKVIFLCPEESLYRLRSRSCPTHVLFGSRLATRSFIVSRAPYDLRQVFLYSVELPRGRPVETLWDLWFYEFMLLHNICPTTLFLLLIGYDFYYLLFIICVFTLSSLQRTSSGLQVVTYTFLTTSIFW